MKYSALALSIMVASSAQANNFDPDFNFSGFGSYSATKSDHETPVFRSRDITDEWCYDCDATLGVQLDVSLLPQFRGSVQVVKRPQDTYSDPELEWAYLAYDVQDFTFQAGRLRLPLFITSQYYYVSYAYPWFRPPADLYDSLLGITAYDGLSVTYETWLNDEWSLIATPFYSLGSKDSFRANEIYVNIESDYSAGLSTQASWEETLINFAYLRSNFTQSVTIPTPMGNITGPETDETYNIFSLGVSQYYEQWHFLLETLYIKDLHRNWYASIDYTIGDFQPYVTYSQRRSSRDNETYMVGLKYTINEMVALNMEYQFIDGDESAQSGHFTRDLTDIKDNDVSIVTFGVSFQF